MLTPQKIKIFYDPRGQVVRTVNPDNSEQRVVFGIPNIINTPEEYTPTPWESYTYDANDLASITHANEGYLHTHAFTPKSALLDALGRTVKTTEHKAHINSSNNQREDVVMQYEYDIRGNLLQVTDALNRIAFKHTYDLRPKEKNEQGEEQPLPPLQTTHIDKGENHIIFDAQGKAIKGSDAKGATVLNAYDIISRPVKMWAKDKTSEDFTQRQQLVYGDTSSLTTPEDTNHNGQLYQHYDEAGLVTVNEYDFKGNALEKIRKVISDTEILSVFGGSTVNCYRVDWEGLNTAILDTTEYKTNSEYDALNRVTELIYPEDLDTDRKILTPYYNRAGALEKVTLNNNDYVKHIAYNAKGQRLMIAFGNDVMTRYTYDQKTFRLKRQRSETYTQNGWEFASNGSVKQDTAYTYDLAGNIIQTQERTTNCGIGGSNALQRIFNYDPLYRLLKATGRENAPTAALPWENNYRSEDHSITTAYTQKYEYDKMGNILKLQHIGNNNFTRNFNYNSSHNKLQSIDIGMTNYAFTYDGNGNQLTETSNRKMEWDAADQLRSFYIEASGNITQYTHYLYDAQGNRVKKLTRTQSGNYTSTTYIDGILEYQTDGTEEQNTLHIMDSLSRQSGNKSRIATVRIGDAMGDTTPEIKYNLEDHLGSSTQQLASNGTTINKEEYYPFGETSFGSYAKKRYRYCGKERDDESGMYYYGARYYSAWTCRFVGVDPLAANKPNLTPFHYCSNNPINRVDPDGMQDGTTPNGGKNKGTKSIEELITVDMVKPTTNLPVIDGEFKNDLNELVKQGLITKDDKNKRLDYYKKEWGKFNNEMNKYNMLVNRKNELVNANAGPLLELKDKIVENQVSIELKIGKTEHGGYAQAVTSEDGKSAVITFDYSLFERNEYKQTIVTADINQKKYLGTDSFGSTLSFNITSYSDHGDPLDVQITPSIENEILKATWTSIFGHELGHIVEDVEMIKAQKSSDYDPSQFTDEIQEKKAQEWERKFYRR